MKTPIPTASQTLQVQPFTVTTEWLSVSTSILARNYERMQRIRGYQINSVGFCSTVVKEYRLDSMGHRWSAFKCQCLESLQGRRASRITFQIEADEWEEIIALCERNNTTPTGFIRAAFAAAAARWEAFDEEQQARTA